MLDIEQSVSCTVQDVDPISTPFSVQFVIELSKIKSFAWSLQMTPVFEWFVIAQLEMRTDDFCAAMRPCDSDSLISVESKETCDLSVAIKVGASRPKMRLSLITDSEFFAVITAGVCSE